MDTTRWTFMTDIEDQNKLPDSDTEDDSDNSLQNDVADRNPQLLQQVEDRIKRCGYKLSTFNYKLMKTLGKSLKTDHLDLLTELYDCDHTKFNDEIEFEASRPDKKGTYTSKLEVGLVLISRRDDRKITWAKVLSALIKIPRWDVLKDLCSPELDEYWNKGNSGYNYVAKSAPESPLTPKQPVESLDSDTRPEMFGIRKNHFANSSPMSDMQDSGINSSSPEQAISSCLSNMTISHDRSGGTNSHPNTNTNGIPQLIPTAMAQNQFAFSPICYQWLAMMGQHPPSLPTQANMQYVNSFVANSAVMSQQQNMFPGTYMLASPPNVETNSNCAASQSSSMPISFSNAFSTLPIGSIPCNYNLAPARGAANNEMQMSNVNELNNSASMRVPRGVSPPQMDGVGEMDNVKIHVLLTYSRDAEQVAKELQLRLWEEFSILAMTAQEMRDRVKHSPGEDVAIRCREVKYVVPLLSKKYIADIGYGRLLDNDYVSSLYNCDENKDDRNLVSSIYTQFVNMCFTEGGRNSKVRPVSVISDSYAIRQQLTPCLINAWHLWREFEEFVDVIRAGLDF